MSPEKFLTTVRRGQDGDKSKLEEGTFVVEKTATSED